MSDRYFANTLGENIPVSDDYQTAAVVFFETTEAVDKTVFKQLIGSPAAEYSAKFERGGDNVYLRIVHAGSDYSFITGGAPPMYIGVACYKVTVGDVAGYRVVADIGADQSTIESYIHSGVDYNHEVIPYISEEDAAPYIVDDRTWDDTPSTNPDDPLNMAAIGGEYAERGIFNETMIQGLNEMPDPEDFELDYGSLVAAYSLSASDMNKIGKALFLPNFWTGLKNKFEGLSDPISFIVDCVELPFGRPDDTGISRFRLGGNLVEDDQGNTIGCAIYTHRYYKYSFGSITLKEIWGTAKDYTDTSISLFLPYVGVKEVDPDIVLNTTTTLIMYLDAWNGDILYLLHASNANIQYKYFRNDNVVYRWPGNCGKKIPLGRVDQTTPIINMAASIASIGAGFAVGGLAGAAMSGLMGVKNNVVNNGFSPTVQTSGGISGSPGRMDFHYAYYIIKRGVPEYPDNWREIIGAPRYQSFTVNDLNGYTEFSDIHVEIETASDEENREIERIMKTGIIL